MQGVKLGEGRLRLSRKSTVSLVQKCQAGDQAGQAQPSVRPAGHSLVLPTCERGQPLRLERVEKQLFFRVLKLEKVNQGYNVIMQKYK